MKNVLFIYLLRNHSFHAVATDMSFKCCLHHEQFVINSNPPTVRVHIKKEIKFQKLLAISICILIRKPLIAISSIP